MGRLAWMHAAAWLACSFFVVAAGCSTRSSPGQAVDAAAPDSPEDVSQQDQSQAFPTCTSPLADAGFTSLSDLPVATLCGSSAGGLVIEETPACQGLILVTGAIGIDCVDAYFFDSGSGALVGTGYGCNGAIGSCTGNAGFKLPAQCLSQGFSGWAQATNLCVDAGSVDAMTDAPGSE